MSNLPLENECCGCGACVDACRHNAIELIESSNNFFIPFINQNKCINCGLCEKKCNILNPPIKNKGKETKAFAAWTTDNELIKKCASGGAFGEIAKHYLTKSKNFVVIGASLLRDSSVKHIEITNIKELPKLLNSKYQQSNATGIYKTVRNRLNEGKYVIFSGTPCQIAALYAFLGKQAKDINNLLTIEVICHGVPSNYLHRLSLKINNAKQIISYRTKSHGWLDANRVTYLDKENSEREIKYRTSDFLFRAYLNLNSLRERCYSCPYATINRVADITLGDFWGFNRHKINNFMGISLVLANTQKGKNVISEQNGLHLQSTDWDEFLQYNQNLFMPTNKQLYSISNNIYRIKKLPIFIQKIIFQQGFSNKFMDYLYRKGLNIIFSHKRKNIYNEIQLQYKKALKDCK